VLIERGDVADRPSVDTRFGRRPPTDLLGDWIPILALAGLCLDGLTTWIVLGDTGYRELNPVITGLWQGHPLLVVGYFGGLGLAVSASTRRHGRLSTAVSTYVFVVMGVFGGLNNLALFVVGPPGLLDLLAVTVGISGATAIQSVVPVCGLIAAAGIVRLRHGPLQ
jgi:hypothetical protein